MGFNGAYDAYVDGNTQLAAWRAMWALAGVYGTAKGAEFSTAWLRNSRAQRASRTAQNRNIINDLVGDEWHGINFARFESDMVGVANLIPEEPGVLPVLVHGSETGFKVQVLADPIAQSGNIPMGRYLEVTPEQLAVMLHNTGKLEPGITIRLISCDTGFPNGPAMRLALALSKLYPGLRIEAPTDIVGVKGGVLTVENGGTWFTFGGGQ